MQLMLLIVLLSNVQKTCSLIHFANGKIRKTLRILSSMIWHWQEYHFVYFNFWKVWKLCCLSFLTSYEMSRIVWDPELVRDASQLHQGTNHFFQRSQLSCLHSLVMWKGFLPQLQMAQKSSNCSWMQVTW